MGTNLGSVSAGLIEATVLPEVRADSKKNHTKSGVEIEIRVNLIFEINLILSFCQSRCSERFEYLTLERIERLVCLLVLKWNALIYLILTLATVLHTEGRIVTQ